MEDRREREVVGVRSLVRAVERDVRRRESMAGIGERG